MIVSVCVLMWGEAIFTYRKHYIEINLEPLCKDKKINMLSKE